MRDAAIDLSRSPARGANRSRSAEAPPLDDPVGGGPVSRAAPRRGGITSAAVAAQRLGGQGAGRGRQEPGTVARLRARLPRVRPLKALTIGAFGVALVGIVANAMVFQRGHHPSPLFGLGRSVDGAPSAAERTAAAAPAPAPIEKTGTIAPPAAPPAEPPPAAVAPPQPKPAAVHRAAPRAAHEDAAKARVPDQHAEAAHPRPGHPRDGQAKAEAKAEPKSDPLAKLIANSAHPAKAPVKAEAKAASAAKPDAPAQPKAKAETPASRPHHRTAAADAAKPVKAD